MEITNRTKSLTEKYDLDPEDIAFCDMIRAGWGKFEAIFYAYHLSYFDINKITTWYREHLKSRPGILKLQSDYNEEDKAARKELQTLKEKVKNQTKRRKSDESVSDDETMSKEELGKMYIRIMRDSTSDDKTKMDASKAYTALYQLQKEQTEEVDNRLTFFLPDSCHYCDRCKNCELKTELENRGCKIRAKRTSPYLWELVKPEEADNINV